MKCSRKGCNNNVEKHPVYGVIPCGECQKKDTKKYGQGGDAAYQFASIFKLHRVQRGRDRYGQDLLQPYDRDKPNSDFFKTYPERVKEYGVEKELEKI